MNGGYGIGSERKNKRHEFHELPRIPDAACQRAGNSGASGHITRSDRSILCVLPVSREKGIYRGLPGWRGWEAITIHNSEGHLSHCHLARGFLKGSDEFTDSRGCSPLQSGGRAIEAERSPMRKRPLPYVGGYDSSERFYRLRRELADVSGANGAGHFFGEEFAAALGR